MSEVRFKLSYDTTQDEASWKVIECVNKALAEYFIKINMNYVHNEELVGEVEYVITTDIDFEGVEEMSFTIRKEEL